MKKMGISSKCLDGDHILMMDFDIPKGGNRCKLSVQILNKVCEVVNFYKLPDFYIFKTKHGFHVICFAKLPLRLILSLYGEFKPLADGAHIRIGGGTCKRFILRVGDEIELEAFYTGFADGRYETSKAHIEFFSIFYDMKIRSQYPDDSHVCVFEMW